MFSHLDDDDMYYTGSRSSKLAVICGCGPRNRRDTYIRKVNRKRLVTITTICFLFLIFVIFSVWKNSYFASNRDEIVDYCSNSPILDYLYPVNRSIGNWSSANAIIGKEWNKDTLILHKLEKRKTSHFVEDTTERGNGKIVFDRRDTLLFKSSVSPHELGLMFYTLRTLTDALSSANITFLLYGGTLLGAYRHHSMIPWDDDIDIWVNGSEIDATKRILKSLHGFSLFHPFDIQWKFYLKNITTIEYKSFAWPYVDIFFFGENKTHIWDLAVRYKEQYVFKKEQVFPLQFRPYQGTLMPVPCDMESVLSATYNIGLCVNQNYIHKVEAMVSPNKRKTVPCHYLHNAYPFVFRHKHEDYLSETVKVGDCVLYELKTVLPCQSG